MFFEFYYEMTNFAKKGSSVRLDNVIHEEMNPPGDQDWFDVLSLDIDLKPGSESVAPKAVNVLKPKKKQFKKQTVIKGSVIGGGAVRVSSIQCIQKLIFASF